MDLLHLSQFIFPRTKLGLPREQEVGIEWLVTRALIQDLWDTGALEQPYYINKIHNLKEALTFLSNLCASRPGDIERGAVALSQDEGSQSRTYH